MRGQTFLHVHFYFHFDLLHFLKLTLRPLFSLWKNRSFDLKTIDLKTKSIDMFLYYGHKYFKGYLLYKTIFCHEVAIDA